jgi:hypothetical protein
MVLALVGLAPMCHAQRTWNVPADQPTIQQAIASAANGDTINVAPGTYIGPIDYAGKAITIAGSGAGVVLLGDGSGAVVRFRQGEGRSSVLSNVTVRGGVATGSYDGGGIYINGASPTIQSSTITANTGCGVNVHNGAPLLTGNTISQNSGSLSAGCYNGNGGLIPFAMGGGIVLDGAPSGALSTEIIGNRIEGNVAVDMAAGVTASEAGNVVLRNNIVTGNTSNGQGAGIGIFLNTSATVVQNLITDNTINPTLYPQGYADRGAGLNIDLSKGTQHSTRTVVVNNTIANNHLLFVTGAGQTGTQVEILNQYDSITFQNNLIISDNIQSAIDCYGNRNPNTSLPAFDHNDVYSMGGFGSPYSYECTNQTGRNGNISAVPLFGAGGYVPQSSSPAIDSGDNSAYALPSLDLAGQPRLQNATGTPSPIIDMGVYEARGVPGTLPPPVDPPTSAAMTVTLDPATITLVTQHHTTVGVTVNVTGTLSGPLQLSCASLPEHASCTFAQSRLAINGAGSYKTTVSVDTSDVIGYAMNPRTSAWTQLAFLLPLPLMFFAKGARRRLLVLLAMVGTLGMTSCNGKLPASTAPGTYAVVVQAADQPSGQSATQGLTMIVTE